MKPLRLGVRTRWRQWMAKQYLHDYNFADTAINQSVLGNLLPHLSEVNGSALYDVGIAALYARTWRQYLGRVPARTLQVGPGETLGCETLFCLSGVPEAWALDVTDNLSFDISCFLHLVATLRKSHAAMCELEGRSPAEFWANLEGEALVKIVDRAHFTVGKGEVRYFSERPLEETGLQDQVTDFLFSHAALEHMRDPTACIREMFRLLRPGGITAHQIDLRDHRSDDSPLTFLKEPDEFWRWTPQYVIDKRGVFTNRWRASQWRTALETAGFEILSIEPDRTVNLEDVRRQRPKFQPQFQELSDEDLSIVSLFVVARKPENS